MKKEVRTVVYDEELRIEAYRFDGILQPFPNHFHEYYVIGYVEDGQRVLHCKNKEQKLDKGSIILFNPGDNHSCVQSDNRALDYRAFNISATVMLDLTEEVTGNRELPRFSQNIIKDEEVTYYFHQLHEILMGEAEDLGKEEILLLLLSTLIQNYGQSFESCIPECRQEIEKACEFIKQHYNKHIYLDQICKYSGLSKSTLLRAFIKEKGITPYRYLENIRINEAKELLIQGATPLSVATKIGFSDQSHFTNYFTSFIGLTPGIYRDIFREKKNGENNGI